MSGLSSHSSISADWRKQKGNRNRKERDKRERKKTYFKARYANNEGKAHISFKEEVRTEFTLSLINKQVQFRTALLQETEQFSPINPSIAWMSVCKSVSVN